MGVSESGWEWEWVGVEGSEWMGMSESRWVGVCWMGDNE